MTNALFKTARIALRLTQRQVAERVRARVEAATGRDSAFDAGYVSRLERGRITWPHEPYRTALCQVLGVGSPADLGLAPKLHSDEVSDSLRRDVLTAAMAALLPPGPTPSRLRAGDVTKITQRTALLERADRREGGQAVHDLALRELRDAVDLTEASTTPDVRTALLGAITRLANLTAWASFDAGRYSQARPLFCLGLATAREFGDAGLLCHVATNAARQEVHLRRSAEALKLTDQVGGRLPAAARAMLAAVRAQAYAVNGDERQVARHLLAAERTYGRVSDLASGPVWTKSITAAKISSDGGFALYLLGTAAGRYDPQVVADLRRAAEADTAQVRVRAMATTRLATVLYRQGECAEADHHAARAAELAQAVGSARLASALTELRAAAGTPTGGHG
ncbi:helix-turn-helix domain-containing protein [Kitasatospora sp. NPDC048722]|uniref:helix-turn-helix domain-containing protein n=1 Tax=Kitasatospora sp. NPDC048722 TaxID=3155639 RepID=UPI0033CA2AC9